MRDEFDQLRRAHKRFMTDIEMRLMELANPDLVQMCRVLLSKRGCRR